MTGALIDALADTLAWVNAKRPSDTVVDVNDDELLHALADTVAEVEAETLYETLSDMKPTHLRPQLRLVFSKPSWPPPVPAW